MDEVAIWQACALALNIDPESMQRHAQSWMHPEGDIFTAESFTSDEQADSFVKLSRRLRENLSNRQHFTPTSNRDVRLSEFAAWCVSIGMDIPPEVAAMAKAAPQAAPVATPAPTATVGTNKKKWDDVRLRALWEESIMPGVTQTSLAQKHGVKRQRIATLINTAKGKFSTRASSNQKNPWGK